MSRPTPHKPWYRYWERSAGTADVDQPEGEYGDAPTGGYPPAADKDAQALERPGPQHDGEGVPLLQAQSPAGGPPAAGADAERGQAHDATTAPAAAGAPEGASPTPVHEPGQEDGERPLGEGRAPLRDEQSAGKPAEPRQSARPLIDQPPLEGQDPPFHVEQAAGARPLPAPPDEPDEEAQTPGMDEPRTKREAPPFHGEPDEPQPKREDAPFHGEQAAGGRPPPAPPDEETQPGMDEPRPKRDDAPFHGEQAAGARPPPAPPEEDAQAPPFPADRPAAARDEGNGAAGRPDTPLHPAAGTQVHFDPAQVLTIANQKGGVGKTTTAVSLSAALADLGSRVLLVDLDPQGNATSGVGVRVGAGRPTVYDVLVGAVDVEDAVEPTSVRNLFVLPSTLDLAGAEIELVSAFSREQKLRHALEGVRQEYDLIVIDCPPSLGLLTVNALAAGNGLLVPIQCEYYALEGLGALRRNIELIRSQLNPNLAITGFILTMLDARTRLSQQVVDEVRAHFGEQVFRTRIPRSVRLAEAPGFSQPITVFDPSSRGALAYRRLAAELLERLTPHNDDRSSPEGRQAEGAPL